MIAGRVRESVQVNEDEIVAGLRFLHRSGIPAEPSGAVTTAAWLSGRVTPGGPTVAIVSGGNVDPTLIQRLVGADSVTRMSSAE